MFNKKQLQALNGLYTNNLVMHKYGLTEDELKNSIEKNKDYTIALDNLSIPWAVQNAVAYASEQKDNWIRYNKDVINEIIKRYAMKGLI